MQYRDKGVMHHYFKDGVFYYYRPHKGQWRIAKMEEGNFLIEQGLTTTVLGLVESCGIENIIRIPQPEELLNVWSN